jgi:hypothetical protein
MKLEKRHCRNTPISCNNYSLSNNMIHIKVDKGNEHEYWRKLRQRNYFYNHWHLPGADIKFKAHPKFKEVLVS